MTLIFLFSLYFQTNKLFTILFMQLYFSSLPIATINLFFLFFFFLFFLFSLYFFLFTRQGHPFHLPQKLELMTSVFIFKLKTRLPWNFLGENKLRSWQQAGSRKIWWLWRRFPTSYKFVIFMVFMGLSSTVLAKKAISGKWNILKK
jgi:hypothetical protein